MSDDQLHKLRDDVNVLKDEILILGERVDVLEGYHKKTHPRGGKSCHNCGDVTNNLSPVDLEEGEVAWLCGACLPKAEPTEQERIDTPLEEAPPEVKGEMP